RLPACVIISVAVQNDLHTKFFCCFHFDDRRSLRHHYRGFNAKHLGGIPYTLCMIAGGGGYYPSAFFFLAELAYFVVRSANLERACDLKVFRFEEDTIAVFLTEKRAFDQLCLT